MKQKLELTWIGKYDEFNLEPRILIEDTTKSFGDKNTDNMLIHGDNLLALKALEQNYSGRIKCIYIDPPYNINAANPHYDDDIPHSEWLSLMKCRLENLRKLLSNDGVIFVQIDDEQQAYLKVMMDEIFGRYNYLNTITVKMKNIAGASGGGEDKRLKKNIEFILVYAKNYDEFKWVKSAYSYTELYEMVNYYKENDISWKYTSVLYDKGEKIYIDSTVDGSGNDIKIFKRENPKFYSVNQVAKIEGISEKEAYYKYIDRIFTTAMPQSSIRTRVLDKVNEIGLDTSLISIEYIPVSGKNKGKVYEQFYKGDKLRLLTWLSDVVEERDGELLKKDLQGTYWDGINLNNLSKEGGVVFPNSKKPEALIQRILEISTKEGDFVLDSFLGSGTTAAVAHKMNRKWIGIEYGEHCYSHCLERIKKVINNEDNGGISKSIDWIGGGGFRFYELASSLLNRDVFGNWVINKEYNGEMLSNAICKIQGFKYNPEQDIYWKQGFSNENDYIYITTNFVTVEHIDKIYSEMKESESLVICCKSYQKECEDKYENIDIRKIPQAILDKCQFGNESYDLNVESIYFEEDGWDDNE
ncbi:site-specific DNA-methyltransferase [Clostridium sp.]|uniref:site-specific DNA-methyltransferase n=1 Tax=Clostridium TaxID=1485 RepID=UPI002905128B|nr:site-specific DNA-methyltransferase [Clostridium sp.]MDU2683610.1 site-specific DNA-methyltransferase [Clostridium sp.]